MTAYAPLHAHSDYSLTDGSMTLEQYVQRLVDVNIPAAALTDTHNLFGAFEFHRRAGEAGIHPVIGVQLLVRSEERTGWGSRQEAQRLLVLVQNRQGFQNLSLLISQSYRRRRERGLWVALEELADHREGLWVLGPPRDGPEKEFRERPVETWIDLLETGQSLFGDRFRVDVPLETRWGAAQQNLLEAARRRSIQALVTHPAYFSKPGNQEVLRLRRAVQENRDLDTLPALPEHRRQQAVLAGSELRDRLPAEGQELLEESLRLAETCQFDFQTDRYHLPDYPQTNQPNPEYLESRCREAVDERSLEADPATIRDRLDHELDIINRMGFIDYFLIVADVVNWAREEGIRVGPGRGSAAGSLVAYLLGITDVDPFAYDLIFERFLNPDRNEMPDIDIDFSDHRRGEVIQYIRERFGTESVAHIITFGKMKPRNALRNVGRIRSEPRTAIDEMAETVPPTSDRSLSELRQESNSFQKMLEKHPERRTWVEQAQFLEGFTRNVSIHAAGILITPGTIDRFLPLYYPDEPDPVPASQFDMYAVEELGYLKLDVLGLTTLSLLDETLERIPAADRPDLENLPPDDERTLEFMARGSLEGIFQFESRGGRRLAHEMAPRSKRELVDCIALNRPGPAQFRDDYLRRRAGKDPVEYPHPDLESILQDTYGLIIYQEQVMAIAREIGGFSWSEADHLRKAMGKKDADLMETQRKRFLEGAREQGYDADWSRDLFEQLARFAEYGFNRSHSAAYGEITYQTAYLKAHFTEAFYAALLTIKSDDRDRISVIADAMQEDEVSFLGPDINRSGADFQVRGGTVRYGLKAIKHVGDNLARNLVKRRPDEGYRSLFEMIRRTPPRDLSTQGLQAMAAGGCFDELGVPRSWVIEQAEDLLNRGRQAYREAESGQENLFASGESSSADPFDRMVAPGSESWSSKRLERAEREALGIVFD